MSFSSIPGSVDLLAQLGVCIEAGADVIGNKLFFDPKTKSALLPLLTELSHANYPPMMSCKFFSYGHAFNVKHTFYSKNLKSKLTIEVDLFTVEIERKFSYFKRQRVLRLCQEAFTSYLGFDYFGRPYEVKLEIVPKIVTKKERKRIEKLQEKFLAWFSKQTFRLRVQGIFDCQSVYPVAKISPNVWPVHPT